MVALKSSKNDCAEEAVWTSGGTDSIKELSVYVKKTATIVKTQVS